MSIDQRPFLIGVAGGTCSGKTTVSEKLAELAGGEHLALRATGATESGDVIRWTFAPQEDFEFAAELRLPSGTGRGTTIGFGSIIDCGIVRDAGMGRSAAGGATI